jgi:hypothetical protein
LNAERKVFGAPTIELFEMKKVFWSDWRNSMTLFYLRTLRFSHLTTSFFESSDFQIAERFDWLRAPVRHRCDKIWRHRFQPRVDSNIREEKLLQLVLWKMVHFALFLVKFSINFRPSYCTVFFHHSVCLYCTKISKL